MLKIEIHKKLNTINTYYFKYFCQQTGATIYFPRQMQSDHKETKLLKLTKYEYTPAGIQSLFDNIIK